jgi:hypothetical protein
MEIHEEARVLAAIMRTAGVTELFVPHQALETERGTVSVQEDVMRDGLVFRLREQADAQVHPGCGGVWEPLHRGKDVVPVDRCSRCRGVRTEPSWLTTRMLELEG